MQSVVLIGLAAVLLLRLSLNVVDPDLWHEMAHAREVVAHGAFPRQDSFAYTPTISPVVHHEWGAGMIALSIATGLGGGGIVLLKLTLAFGLAAVCWRCARRHGTGVAVLAFLAPVAIFLADNGFSTVRAQLYSFLLGACLLYLLDRDRAGGRRWPWIWLPLHLLWLNLHAGFVVGVGWLGLHWLEQLVRRRPHLHLLGVLVASTILVAVNPHGLDYYAYLARALTLPRTLVTEWSPLWTMEQPHRVVLFLVSLGVLAYAVRCLGIRKTHGLPIVLVSALAALLHGRMLPFYGVAWICHVPTLVHQTPLGEQMERFATRRRALLLGAWCVIAALCVARSIPMQPWRLRVPAAPIAGAGAHVVYPVGAVRYLEHQGFSGNLMVHFNDGAFVLWRLYPKVKISMDSRYEVAYAPALAEENHRLYMARGGWQRALRADLTDAVLVPLRLPLAGALRRGAAGWKEVYRDTRYALFARPDRAATLAVVRADRVSDGTFP